MSLAGRIYCGALRLLPGARRRRDRDSIALTFDELSADARRARGRAGVALHLARELRDLVTLEHLGGRAARFAHDVRYAVRSLLRNPGFAAVALTTLALSIGANSAIFSVVYAVLLKPLPFRDPSILMIVGQDLPGEAGAVGSTSPATFYDWRARQTSFEELAGFDTTTVTLTGHGEPERIQGVVSAGSVLAVLGVPPLHGRALSAADDRYGRERVVVVSHSFWRRVLRGRVSAIGESVTLGGRDCTVVGVMPPGFQFPDRDSQFWAAAQFNNNLRYSRTEYSLIGIGRLRKGRAAEQAAAELNTIMAGIRAEHPQINDEDVGVRPLHAAYTAGVQRPVVLVMAAVGFVLLIACANLANLLLARATGRAREMAVRQALGADRSRLLQQLLTESVLLALAGAAMGLLLAGWLLGVLVGQLPPGMPRVDEIAPDPVVVAATFVISTLCGIVFGLSPALFLSGARPVSALREGGRAADARGWVRSTLVAAEVALAMMLLVGSFAVLALMMAALGVFGVLSYSVGRRRRELGIRLAFGADSRSVRRLVVRGGLVPAGVGIVVGSIGAFAIGGALENLLFGVRPTDPATFGAVALFLMGVAALACYVPARRATRIDPVMLLKAE